MATFRGQTAQIAHRDAPKTGFAVCADSSSIEGITSIDLLEVDVPPIHVRVNQLHADPVAYISTFEPVD